MFVLTIRVMKLWKIELLGELPGRLLCALHRDVCRIRTGAWKAYKSRRTWYYALPWGAVAWYHARVLREMVRRGWKPNPRWFDPLYRGNTPRLDDDMVDPDSLGSQGWKDIFDRACPDTLKEERERLAGWKGGSK